MSGGVSLAVWMGGVAHTLLRWSQQPEDYWCPTKPSIDVIAGTSAGGLNGVFLAAALAWNIPHVQFLEDVRNAWLRLGSIERLLRSPFDADPLSLFDGEEKYRREVESVLCRWWKSSSSTRAADDDDFRIHLVVPTTLLRPNIDAYYDDLGTNFVEPTNAGTFTFTRQHFAEERYIEHLALAARASSAFPVAFDPAFVPAADGDFPEDLLNFKGSRWVADGGLIVNRPLGHALDGIARQKAAGPVDRWLLYVIPDPEPVTASKANGLDQDDDNDKREEPLSLAASLGRVATAAFSQSLIEDLREWERQRSLSSSQRDYRYWIAEYPERSELAAHLYPRFKQHRAEQSARQAVRGLSAQLRRSIDIAWKGVESVLVLTRSDEAVDWHPEKFPPKAGNGRLSLIGKDDTEWDWGISAVEYMAQVVLDLVRELWPRQAGSTDVENTLADVRETIHDILEFIRAYRRIDADFWSARFQALGSGADRPGDREETLGNWAASAWATWPAIDPSQPGTLPHIDLSPRRTARLPSLEAFPEQLDQRAARVHLGQLARALALTYLEWRSQPVVRAEIEGQKTSDEVQVVAALDSSDQPETEGRLTDRAVSDVLTRLLEFWIVQVSSSPQSRVWEQQIRLAHFSADSQNPLSPRFESASDKLTGVQLAHFGAFYKASWRANDWMWGRLDGTQHVLRLVDALGLDEELVGNAGPDLPVPGEDTTAEDASDGDDGSQPSRGEQVRQWVGELAERTSAAWNAFTNKAQEGSDSDEVADDSEELDMSEITGLENRTKAALRQILSRELVTLARSISAETSEGALTSPDERSFVDEVSRATNEGRVPAAQTAGLLDMAPVGKLSEEIKSDQFTRTVTHTAAVAAGSLSGARSGLGPLRQLFLQIRNVVLLPFYLLAQSVTAGGVFVRTIGMVALILAIVLIVIDLAAADLPTWLLALSWVVLAFWSLFAISRSTGSRLIFAVIAAATVLAVGGVYMTQWVAVGGGDSRCAVAITDLEVDIAEFSVIIDRDECVPVDEVAAGWAQRRQSVGRWLGLAAIAALASQWLLSLAPRSRYRSWPSFSEGATVALVIVVLAFPPTGWSRGWLSGALVLAAAANVFRAAGARAVNEKRSWSHGLFGVVAGLLVGGVVVAASDFGVRVASDPQPIIESITQNPAWALVAVVVIPLVLSFAWDITMRIWKMEPTRRRI